jgi:ribonuclease HII
MTSFPFPIPSDIAGVDEAGRGPLAGSVVAAAVILDPDNPIDGLRDSKKLSESQREKLAPIIRERAAAWALGEASVEEIDRLNILQATMLAMTRAIEALTLEPGAIWIDGNRAPVGLRHPVKTIVKGDDLIPAISAASILAKTARDHELIELDRLYPQYGFARHKGYGTKAHLMALEHFGACPAHRKTFAPVAKAVSRLL